MEPILASDHAEGARMLQEGVISALGAIEFPEGLNVPNDVIVTLIRHDFNASNFDKLNTELRIIESTAEYKGIKPDGARAFTLLIMWWADYYRVGDKKKHHYGWQIFLDGRRIVNPHKILLPDNDPLQYFRVIEVSAVINPDLDVNKSVSVGEDGGKIEIVIDQGEYDEDSLHLLERGTRG